MTDKTYFNEAIDAIMKQLNYKIKKNCISYLFRGKHSRIYNFLLHKKWRYVWENYDFLERYDFIRKFTET